MKTTLKIATLAFAICSGLHAFGMFGYYIFCAIGGGYFSPITAFIFLGYLAPAAICIITLFDAKRGRTCTKGCKLVMLFMFFGSVAFVMSMTAHTLYNYFDRIEAFPNGLQDGWYGAKYFFCNAYNFAQYHIPTAFTPFLLYFMLRLRRMLLPKLFPSGTDSQTEKDFERAERIFYFAVYSLALILLAGALVCLCTGRGYGAIASMLWGWMLFIPLIIAFAIWYGMFLSAKGDRKLPDFRRKNEQSADS